MANPCLELLSDRGESVIVPIRVVLDSSPKTVQMGEVLDLKLNNTDTFKLQLEGQYDRLTFG